MKLSEGDWIGIFLLLLFLVFILVMTIRADNSPRDIYYQEDTGKVCVISEYNSNWSQEDKAIVSGPLHITSLAVSNSIPNGGYYWYQALTYSPWILPVFYYLDNTITPTALVTPTPTL